ncbi:cell division protein ZapC [Candidatus Symbiopectobacterium sp. NZEC151]|uniref:cell division protein ZapC n=1 Tax=Candidatus Symbiopectobacterium sp. NZEC151 TaxID=2820470 RepID=UPI002227DDB2|nr:cell division protein ZapC [Candidatus Symbiopectobacterium sp. NZEC151]MCW2473568.1 cell division protein ZapC [Candidatus Symbiopectobacterium sp. NZEC151]
MKLKPDDNWRWYFDAEHDRMMLDLANGMVFRSRFSAKTLTPDAFAPVSFCVDDAALFFTFQEKCQPISLQHELQAELILNALVAHRYLKPLMPKSWYFAQQPHEQQAPQMGDAVRVMLAESQEIACFMVVEHGEKASLCVLAQEALTLNGKTMQLGEAIKIMHDRLLPQQSALAGAMPSASFPYAKVV